MSPRITLKSPPRARRFALHFPVYYREAKSPDWFEGKTENISYSGLLFRCTSALQLKAPVELRLMLAAGLGEEHPAEVVCKGAVVRIEHRNMVDTPTALAVALQDYRFVRTKSSSGVPTGTA